MSELLTVSEVARILRVDDTTVWRWVKQDHRGGCIASSQYLPGYRIKHETLDRILGDAI